MGDFLDLKLNEKNLDTYYIRQSILNALTQTLPSFNGKLLDIGCGKMPYKNFVIENSKVTEYIGLDIAHALQYSQTVEPDYLWDGIIMPFESCSFNSAVGTEVLEHCPEPEIILKETYRVLKPNGVFFFTVPFLWNLHETPNDQYRYTPYSLDRHLSNSGFTEIEIKATGGWHGSLAQMLGLWVRRAPMTANKRKWLSKILKPVIQYLIKKDRTVKVLREGQMITGLYGTAKKICK